MGFAEEDERRKREALIKKYANKLFEVEEEYREVLAKRGKENEKYGTKVYDSEYGYKDEEEDEEEYFDLRYGYEDLEYEYVDSDVTSNDERGRMREARDTVRRLYLRAEGRLRYIRGDKIGKNKWRTDTGDQLLFAEKSDLEIRTSLDEIRREGVTDEDIRRFYNMSPIERTLDSLLDRQIKEHIYQAHGIEVPYDRLQRYHDRYFPYYAELIEGDASLGDNKPLPQVLKKRIDIFIEREVTTNPQRFEGRIKSYKTMNALIRAAIRKGKV